MQLLQLSEATAALRRLFFQAVDSTDGMSPEAGLTGVGRISKNGAATAASSGSLVEIDSTNMPGRYYIELTAAELDTIGIIEFRYKAAACAEVIARGQVVPFDPYDAVRMGLTSLPNAAAEAAGGLYTRGTGAGQINQSANGMVDTNTVRMNNVAQSLLDLVDFADAGYDPATNKVQGVVLVDTLTTYTGNTLQTGDSFARLGAPAGASVSADIAAIEAQTDDIGAAGAGLTALATQASVNTIDDFLDTEIAAIITTLGTPSNLGSGATVAANLVDIEAQTDDIGVAGAGLTAINLPNQTMDIVGNITGNLSGSVGSVTGAVGSVTGLTPATIAAAWLAAIVEGAHTLGDYMRLLAGYATGLSSGGGTATIVFRDVGNTKNRISATVDANGNRTAIGTRDGT